MDSEQQKQRRAQIEKAAFEVLAEKGYRKSSMLQIAKRAKASNETLYAWYGNKQALFAGIIEENGKAVRHLLQEAKTQHADPLETLEHLGPLLLSFVATQNAVIINRAAINDAAETGTLAQAIDKIGRDGIFPLVSDLMAELDAQGRIRCDQGPQDAADTYVALLFGEVQIRQAFGTLAPFDQHEIARRAARAFDLILRLYAA